MKNSKVTSIILLSSILFILPAVLFGIVDTAWVRTFSSNGNYDDCAAKIISDRSGNIYVAGGSYGFGTSEDFLTIKYSSNGIQKWVEKYNGPGNSVDYVTGMAVDSLCNIYVAGGSRGLAGDCDFAIVKYDSNGIQQRVIRYNGPANNNDAAEGIAVDNSGNIYVTGWSWSESTYYDYVTIKYDSAGNQQWLQRYNGSGNQNDASSALVIDNLGNVYVTGYGTDSLDDISYVTIKYDSNGNQQWVAKYNGQLWYEDVADAIALDNTGNVYVAGYSIGFDTDRDYATVKYNSNGVQQWVARYNGPGDDWDEISAIAVSNTGNVYVTGYSFNAAENEDVVTIKYNLNGVQQWVARYNDPGNYADYAHALVVDSFENIYVTGHSALPSSVYSITIKYNSSGVEQWVKIYNGSGNGFDLTLAMVVNNQGSFYVTGYTYSLSTGCDFLTIKYTQLSGVEENQVPVSANCNPFEIYPNPARTYATIRFPLTADRTIIRIYDITGKIVKIFEQLASEQNTGNRGIQWNLKDDNNRKVANGIYFIEVTAEDQGKRIRETKKIEIVK